MQFYGDIHGNGEVLTSERSRAGMFFTPAGSPCACRSIARELSISHASPV